MSRCIYTKKVTDWEQLSQLIDIKTACILLGTSDVTVGKMLKKGQIKGNKVGREWRIDRDSIREYISGYSSGNGNIVEFKRA